MTIFSIFLTFVLTGVVGNMLVQKWQQKNWMQQQRLLRAAQDIEALKTTIDDLLKLAGGIFLSVKSLRFQRSG